MHGLTERHPYIVARDRYIAGEIPRVQAVGMILADPEFTAAVDLSDVPAKLDGMSREEIAWHVVDGPWTRRLLEAQRCPD